VTITQHQGQSFPTLLHAQWALFFDDLLIPWTFRPTNCTLSGGCEFVPDFWLPRHELWFQVGGEEWDRGDFEQWQEFAAAADGTPCTAHINFVSGMACDWHGRHTIPPLQEEWRARDTLYSVGTLPAPEGIGESGPLRPVHDSIHNAHDEEYQWTSCPACGFVGAEFDGRADRLGCGHGDQQRDKNYRANDPRILAAYRLARQTTSARMQSNCARCEVTLSPGDLIAAGRPVARRRWYHADCLLASRRERYPSPDFSRGLTSTGLPGDRRAGAGRGPGQGCRDPAAVASSGRLAG